MSDQETDFLHQIQDEDSICRSMHNLSTVEPATVCICSAKRQSPSLLDEPAQKRSTVHPPPLNLLGYKKLPLPPFFLSVPLPPLRRTLSEPIYSAILPPLDFSTSLTPIKTQNDAQESYPFPKAPPLLYRTMSDPNPALNRQVMAAAETPPRPPARRRSPRFGESPNARRLRRMKERLREMSQWANQVSSSDDGDETVQSENRCIDNDSKESDRPQESVFVERNGDSLVLHFKCPCGEGYQILLCGDSCYYKLSRFRQ